MKKDFFSFFSLKLGGQYTVGPNSEIFLLIHGRAVVGTWSETIKRPSSTVDLSRHYRAFLSHPSFSGLTLDRLEFQWTVVLL